MGKRIVVALGGNALGKNLSEQMAAVKQTSRAIADLIEQDNQVIISHGNGPQVGMIQNAMDTYAKSDPSHTFIPLSVCVAMSQGYIGYDLQNALREELLNRGIHKPVVTQLTQVLVDKNDAAFLNPTKPIGLFLTKEEADVLAAGGKPVMEDSGRGYRRAVASPAPVGIVEFEAIKALSHAGQVVIACGGGGIPVVAEGNHLRGMPAVIDKDFASALLAKLLNADCLIILTAVEKVAINFGKENQQWLSEMTVGQAEEYIKEGHFAKGSMLPKVMAALEFAKSAPHRYSLITLLDKAKEGMEGKTGTVIR